MDGEGFGPPFFCLKIEVYELYPGLRSGSSCCRLRRLDSYTRKRRLPSQKYAKWLNEEVVYIITDDEERKEFLKLPSDDARDAYINEFWEIRNPLRGSERNPYKEEHYKRIEYANETFGRETATPGWKTDMGRTYILFGKPRSRAPYKGYGQIYPLELWFYSNNSGNPSFPPFF